MAETKRSATDLLTNLFQDGQAVSAITEQDLRDLIESMRMPHGGASFEGNSTATTIGTIGQFEVVTGTFVPSAMLVDFTIDASGLLTYIGVPDRHMHIVSNFDFITASNNQVISFQWFKGVTPITPPVNRKTGTGSDVGAVSIHADVVLTTGDTLQLKVTNKTSASTVTVQNCYLFVMGMFI